MSERSIALNRFGLGARPDDAPVTDPKGWLTGQIARFDPRPVPLQRMASSNEIITNIGEYQDSARDVRRAAEAQKAAGGMPGDDDNPANVLQQGARRTLRGYYLDAVDARIATALTSPAPFMERMAHFWANHFALSADKLTVTPLAGAFEFEAIRPHVVGRFADMLNAAERHPAMLLYLDQAQSVGPESRFGRRAGAGGRGRGLNENLAREILELHTLGVNGGYQQSDVTELARALTGWTVPRIGRRGLMAEGREGAAFVPALHEPGARTLLRKSYPQAGADQSEAIFADLAAHPATARHLATKLARHFGGDVPPPAMITRLERAYLQSGGDLPTVYRAIIASPEAWVPQPLKFRTPWEWSIAVMRATGSRAPARGSGSGLQVQLGQTVWKPGQPNGFDDTAASWAGSDALMRRVEAAERLAQRTAEVDARALAKQLFPGALSTASDQALARAESPGQALAMLLVTPEMMRR